ncbi:type II toxin-antitoxin system RelE/ParE family toxin [Mannheimia indoligenes]|uniref:type II toxin-antitoxin system RelE/ParE family toxin n=1 Tax=Mannheimia indoligenes TaxID=3103145 RepID=UPI002FE6BC9F
MKQDYIVRWSEMARFQLLDKAEYIYDQSQNEAISDRFITEMEMLAEKLGYIADAYADGRFHIFPLKNGHSVKFLVMDPYVMIYAFFPRGVNH